MLWQFQVDNRATQPCMCMYPFSPNPSYPGCPITVSRVPYTIHTVGKKLLMSPVYFRCLTWPCMRSLTTNMYRWSLRHNENDCRTNSLTALSFAEKPSVVSSYSGHGTVLTRRGLRDRLVQCLWRRGPCTHREVICLRWPVYLRAELELNAFSPDS